MKKIIFLVLSSFLISGSSFCQEINDKEAKASVEKNKKISAMYHDLNPDDIDKILTEDFIGRHEQNRFTWNRERHRQTWTNNKDMQDSIFHQIAEGDWVATRFVRKGIYGGRPVRAEIMHFKRFKNGKIAEIWEYTDHNQWEEEEE